MLDTIEDRACALAVYMIETGATVRSAAKHFGISKSTVCRRAAGSGCKQTGAPHPWRHGNPAKIQGRTVGHRKQTKRNRSSQ